MGAKPRVRGVGGKDRQGVPAVGQTSHLAARLPACQACSQDPQDQRYWFRSLKASWNHRRRGAGVSVQPQPVTTSPGRVGPMAFRWVLVGPSSGSPWGSPAAVDVIDLIVLVEGNGLHAIGEGAIQHSDSCRTKDNEHDRSGPT